MTTYSALETFALGCRLGELARPGDIICLVGDLGAGKTQLAQGLASGLDIPISAVTSPTYALIAEHDTGRIPLYHMDAYRLGDVSELGPIGFDDYLSRADGVLAIEWADRIASAIADDRLEITIEIPQASDVRHLVLTAYGDRYESLLTELDIAAAAVEQV